MDEKQTQAFNIILEGHNAVLTGQAGTGKSFVLKEVSKEFNRVNRRYGLTSTTGLGATLFETVACTVHKWLGKEDWRHQNAEIVHLVSNDERFERARSNILHSDASIIDEVFMLSAKVLNQIEYLCRALRNNNKYFGGMQLVLSGDFYQLQPVRNELYGDHGHPCFSVSWFAEAFPHKINLESVHRQSDQSLVKAVNDLERGDPSPDTVALINSLSRSPPEKINSAVHLFARNIGVLFFNYQQLANIPGTLHTFVAEDEGDRHYVDQFLAPQRLGMKLGCPVMLLTNLSDHLVNGSIGSVEQIYKDKISVKFELFGRTRTVDVERFTFTKYDPVSKTIIAKRRQFPITLAFSFTIHKSQGMSITNLVIDCKNASQPGQIGVAVGRATSTEGICVKNFKLSLCRPHTTVIKDFYREVSSQPEVKGDCSCCKKEREDELSVVSRDEEHDDDEDDEMKIS